MHIEPMTALIGAEVVGADLAHLTDDSFDAIEQAFTAHQALLSPETHVAFAKRFGE